MSRAITMTYEIAHAVGTDAANAAMRAAGRAAWSADDYDIAVDTEYRLWWRAQDREMLARRAQTDTQLRPYAAVITADLHATREYLEWALYADTTELITWAKEHSL